MQQKTLTLTDRQVTALLGERERTGVSESEIVRRVLDAWIDRVSMTVEPEPELEPIYHGVQKTGGTKVIRIWAITKDRIDALANQYSRLTKSAIVDRLVNAPDDVIDSILSGEYEPAPKVTQPTRPTFVDYIENTGNIGYFLADHCAKGPGLSVTKEHFYVSYEHSLPEGVEMEPKSEIVRVLSEIYGFAVTDHSAVIGGLALRPNAWAVKIGAAVGVEVY